LKNRLIIILCLLPIAAIASADSQPWLKKENPNELFAVTVSTEHCPISVVDLDELVNGVLVRARIKKKSAWAENELLLSVEIGCKLLSDSMWAFRYDVFYSRFSLDTSGNLIETTAIDGKHYGIGTKDEDGMRSAIRELVEDAITDYLKANFDLGEGE